VIGTGIYPAAGGRGFYVRWRDHGRTQQKYFPPDTPPDVMKRFRAQQLGQAAPAADEQPGSLTRALVRFLRLRRGKACYKADKAHLRPWARAFGRRSPWAITAHDIADQVAGWEVDGYSAREIHHRVKLLKQFYRWLNPNTERTPCHGVELPKKGKTRAVAPSPMLVQDVALALHKQEICGRLRDGKTRARFLVLATCGIRPAQVRRAQPIDIDIARGEWQVRPAKGDHGTTIYFRENAEMRAAVQLFITAQAWGEYDQRSFTKTLQRNGWPKGRDVRPYTMRHGVGQAMSERGVDLGDIQEHYGHASSVTTRQSYVPGQAARLQAAVQQIDGRFTTEMFAPTPPPRHRKRRAMLEHQEKPA